MGVVTRLGGLGAAILAVLLSMALLGAMKEPPVQAGGLEASTTNRTIPVDFALLTADETPEAQS